MTCLNKIRPTIYNIKVRGSFVQTLCIEKESYVYAI